MVLKKKLDSGYNGFLVPTIPRCPRSKRNPRRQNIRDDQVCAFELLASLAGKLLQESESSASSNSQEGNYQAVIGNDGVKEEHLQADKTVNSSGILFTVLAKNAESDACTKIEACSTDLGEATDNNVQSAIEKRLDESSGSDIKLSLQSRKDVKLGSRDDDGKFSKCCKSSTKLNSYKPPSGFGRRRMRNFVKSEYWKVAPRSRDFETSRSDGGWKSFYCKRKTCYNRAKYHRETLCKKRRCFDQNSVVTSDGGMSSESVSNSPEKSLNADKGSLNPNAPHASISTKDSHVKFNIKSLKVPELSIEVPDKATIGSLKKLIMEALITILEGGLSVGVHIHGKKVRDDNRTLFQTGLSCKDNLDTVDFTLEPDPVQASPPTCYANPPLLLCNTIPLLPGSASEALLADIPLIDSRNLGESNHQESSSSHTDIILTDKPSTDCKALVIVSENSVQALAVVPLNQKGKRSEHVQRRIRRPFSVSEVEALVKAVEDLGTGRWRDVKLRAFENADHRTYVDLKDKWKTLVHTARISPQQRRGEPVPQELLDRVMSAHSYWSDQHQAKQHGSKHQSKTDLKLIEGPAPQQGFVIW